MRPQCIFNNLDKTEQIKKGMGEPGQVVRRRLLEGFMTDPHTGAGRVGWGMITLYCCPTRGPRNLLFFLPPNSSTSKMEASVVSGPESINRKTEVRTHQARRSPLLD